MYEGEYDLWEKAVSRLSKTPTVDLLDVARNEKEEREYRIAALSAIEKTGIFREVHKVFHLVYHADEDIADEVERVVCKACRDNVAARNQVLMLVSHPDEFRFSMAYTDIMTAIERFADKFDFLCNAPKPVWTYHWEAGPLPSTDNPRVLALLAMADPSGITLERLLTSEPSTLRERALGACAAARPQWGLSHCLNLCADDPAVFYAAWTAAREAALAGDTAAVGNIFELYDDPEMWKDEDKYFEVADKKITKKFYPSHLCEEDFEKDRFYELLGEAQDAISAMSDIVPSYDRWQMHQLVSEAWQRQRANKLGIKLVRGVFPSGTVPEESIFHASPETVINNLGLSDAVRYSTIGVGCEDLELLQHESVPKECQVEKDYGWVKPGYPDRVEYAEWDTEGNLKYVRSSATGRTNYTLIINDEGKVTLV